MSKAGSSDGGSGPSSKSLGMSVQKKVLGKISGSKTITKAFIDDDLGHLLDLVHKLSKRETGSSKEADKLQKDTVKVIVKVAILSRNKQFSDDEMVIAAKAHKKFNTILCSVLSMYEVAYSLDVNHLVTKLNECREMLVALVSAHLTSKSVGRINHVFDYWSDPKVIRKVLSSGKEDEPVLHPIMEEIVKLLNRLMEEDKL